MPRQKPPRPDGPKFPDTRLWVRSVLDKTGWTQEKLAEVVGVGHSLVRKWASGRNRPSWGNTLKLAAIYDSDKAAQDPVESFPMAPMEHVLIEHFRLLSSEQKELVFNQVLTEATKRSQLPAAHEPKS